LLINITIGKCVVKKQIKQKLIIKQIKQKLIINIYAVKEN
jgi:hypothetical protein